MLIPHSLQSSLKISAVTRWSWYEKISWGIPMGGTTLFRHRFARPRWSGSYCMVLPPHTPLEGKRQPKRNLPCCHLMYKDDSSGHKRRYTLMQTGTAVLVQNDWTLPVNPYGL